MKVFINHFTTKNMSIPTKIQNSTIYKRREKKGSYKIRIIENQKGIPLPYNILEIKIPYPIFRRSKYVQLKYN